MNELISPVVLYAACALGAVGVVLAMPRKKVAPFVVGAILAALAFGVVMVGLGVKARQAGEGHLPSVYFYVFSVLALGSALRVITHPRPIYSALYFILTIIASSGLYLILQAEFMAFALIIVYAGAILITYMFVIMLASEGASEDATEGAEEYDRVAREPVVATLAGFVLLAALTSMLGGGVGRGVAGGDGVAGLRPATEFRTADRELAVMVPAVERSLRDAGLLQEGEGVALRSAAGMSGDEDRKIGAVDVKAGTIRLTSGRVITRDQWPADLEVSNTQGVAFSLIDGHPAAIEMAGVILLMAMLGAVVLARKKVEMDEQAKALAAERAKTDDELGMDGPFVAPAVGGDQ